MTDRVAPVFRWGSFYPTHCVVAVVAQAERAERAVVALSDAGFAAKDITSVAGREAIANDKAFMDSRNVVQRAQGLFPSEEDAIVQEYLREAEGGSGFVLARPPERERRERAHQLLQANGGTAMRYDGDNAILDLG